MIDIAGIVKQALNKEIAAGGVRPVSGGDINDAYLVTLADGQKVFLKVNSPKNVYCIIKIPKVADKNGESCISILEKIA